MPKWLTILRNLLTSSRHDSCDGVRNDNKTTFCARNSEMKRFSIQMKCIKEVKRLTFIGCFCVENLFCSTWYETNKLVSFGG